MLDRAYPTSHLLRVKAQTDMDSLLVKEAVNKKNLVFKVFLVCAVHGPQGV